MALIKPQDARSLCGIRRENCWLVPRVSARRKSGGRANDSPIRVVRKARARTMGRRLKRCCSPVHVYVCMCVYASYEDRGKRTTGTEDGFRVRGKGRERGEEERYGRTWRRKRSGRWRRCILGIKWNKSENRKGGGGEKEKELRLFLSLPPTPSRFLSFFLYFHVYIYKKRPSLQSWSSPPPLAQGPCFTLEAYFIGNPPYPPSSIVPLPDGQRVTNQL